MRKFVISFVPVLYIWFLSLTVTMSTVSPAISHDDEPPLVKGLSWSFYRKSCPDLKSIVKKRIDFFLSKDITQAAGILRLHFHDCFVQGCDASILLDGSASGPSEQSAPPNLSLRAQAFKIINDIKENVEAICPNTVSCADITTLAARESVKKAGGPSYRVPLGRRDGLSFAFKNVTVANLPAPTSNITTLINAFSKKSLDKTDLVALSGGHTIGIGHCSSFSNRLYPTQDMSVEESFAQRLYKICPTNTTNSTTVLDIRSPNVFDNKYFVDLVERQALFTSDHSLLSNSKTKKIVHSFANNQTLFFQKFRRAIIKMGQVGVLTGKLLGEIRSNCSALNSPTSYASTLSTLVDDAQILEL